MIITPNTPAVCVCFENVEEYILLIVCPIIMESKRIQSKSTWPQYRVIETNCELRRSSLLPRAKRWLGVTSIIAIGLGHIRQSIEMDSHAVHFSGVVIFFGHHHSGRSRRTDDVDYYSDTYRPSTSANLPYLFIHLGGTVGVSI